MWGFPPSFIPCQETREPMALLGLNNVSLSFGGPAILDAVSLQIETGERLGLLGRNGAGKSTLLKVLAGALAPDAGELARQPGLRVASLRQDIPLDLAGSVRGYLREVCSAARPGTVSTLARRGTVSTATQRNTAPAATQGEAAWEIESLIDRTARDLALDLDVALETLSAGSRRRVLLAAALVQDAELLILDEPTNHLDIDTIRRLEDALLRRRGTLVFVTHDRSFLGKLATRILDLDRGVLRSYQCTYDAYLDRRDEELRAEAEQAALFDKKLAQEEAWVRRGIKARRTRNEGRIRALESLRLERGARRDEVGRVKAQLHDAEKSGRIVLRVRNLGFAYGSTPIVRGFSATILRGDRIGILGPNGCGKTTLIDLLLGDLAPQEGTVTAGTKLEVVRFAQLQDVLDEAKTVVENVAEGRDTITIGGVERNVVGYLRDFLFTSEQIHGPITMLSGGERRRLQLAKMLARPCNVLVLDEPTNDLDLETLELIEDLLLSFKGTLLLVSHDRVFLDNVVTSTLAFEGAGRWQEYVGGYTDWLRQKPPADQPPAAMPGRSKTASAAARPRRISFGEKRELAALPGAIERMEAEMQGLLELMASPDFYKKRGDEVAELGLRLAAMEGEVQRAYGRWMELEALVVEDGV